MYDYKLLKYNEFLTWYVSQRSNLKAIILRLINKNRQKNVLKNGEKKWKKKIDKNCKTWGEQSCS